MQVNDVSDEQLVALLQHGDEQAYAMLYQRYAVVLVGFAESKLYSLDDARDLVQELFVDLWARRSSISIQEHVKGYLFGAARHRIIDHIRKNLVRTEYAERMRQLSPAFCSLEAELDARELAADVAKKLAELPESMRNIYEMSRDEGKTTREIAGQLQISEQTVKNNISKVLKHLRKSLQTLFFSLF